jgi:hypothetical protein
MLDIEVVSCTEMKNLSTDLRCGAILDGASFDEKNTFPANIQFRHSL